jgi:hypothetical protein
VRYNQVHPVRHKEEAEVLGNPGAAADNIARLRHQRNRPALTRSIQG